jgi:hypothetical protein
MQVQDEPSQRDHMLESCRSCRDDGHVKIILNEPSPQWGMGSNSKDFTKIALNDDVHVKIVLNDDGHVWFLILFYTTCLYLFF